MLYAGELLARVELPKRRLPRRSTFNVTLRDIGIEELEGQIAEMGMAMAKENRASQMFDGVDDASQQGLATHGKDLPWGTGPQGSDMPGALVSHLERAIAQQILDQGGDYLMIVKRN
jgi:hypothetical protein